MNSLLLTESNQQYEEEDWFLPDERSDREPDPRTNTL